MTRRHIARELVSPDHMNAEVCAKGRIVMINIIDAEGAESSELLPVLRCDAS